MPLKNLQPRLIADRSELASLLDLLRGERIIALDTESNSFHVYRERVCLIQISTRSMDFVVDPLGVDPASLAEVLCDGRETVLHGADYDVRCLRREYGWRLPRLFDTMAAARRLGRSALGLSALVEAQFGVRLSKKHQRADWGRRPLPRELIAYAAMDTHFLLSIFDALSQELGARGALEEARKEFDRIAAAEPSVRAFDPDGWRRLKGARELDGLGRSALHALWVAREEKARALDLPPFKVLAEQTMVELARTRPAGEDALARISGITPSVLHRWGGALREALRGSG